ncbi:hypothetical protein DLAC_11629 [Tieghemostelium lacteum]|uniref:Uncharacterized protein n=1 Tax=Tieghemostelium lacteum TaxID=361077 RepID=A0A151ZG08_TIELA|nr:hypothetical protein DLAC_11629 [Tieghemostelium lacteum]|eukprot:KYQ92903.1 hypothetical protein DLAC_11629 [Tieghemostelium lacteum]
MLIQKPPKPSKNKYLSPPPFVGAIFREVNLPEDQKHFTEVLFNLIGSKPYYHFTEEGSSNELYFLKYILTTGFQIRLDFLDYRGLPKYRRNNVLPSHHKRQSIALCFLTTNPYSISPNTNIFRHYYCEIARYCPEDVSKFYLIGHTSSMYQNESKDIIDNIAGDILKLDPDNPPIQLSLYPGANQYTNHLFTDLFYAQVEQKIYKQYPYEMAVDTEVNVKFTDNLRKEPKEIDGVFQIVKRDRPLDIKLFREVFGNKYILSVISIWINTIHKEFGYHQSELRKGNELSLYFMLRHKHFAVLLDILKKQRILAQELYCHESFIEILFLSYSDKEEIVSMYIERFYEYCEKNLSTIIEKICFKGSVSMVKHILNRFKNSVISLRALQTAIEGNNRKLIKYIFKEYKFVSMQLGDKKKLCEDLIAHCKYPVEKETKSKVSKYCTEKTSFITKLFQNKK